MKQASFLWILLVSTLGLSSAPAVGQEERIRLAGASDLPNEPLPDIVAILNAAVKQKIVFSKDELAKTDGQLDKHRVNDANSNDYADHGGGIAGAPAASGVADAAENYFGSKDPRTELAYQRACALPYNQDYYINFCAKLGKFYEKRGDLRMALAVFTQAPKCAHETGFRAQSGPPCMMEAAVVYSRTGDEASATRVYGELCSRYATDCEIYNERGGHADLAAAQEQWQASVQAEKDQRRQEAADRAERAQESDARFNAVLGALQAMPGGNDPNAILNAGAQQAAALRAVGDAAAARQAAVTQQRVASQPIALQPTTYVSNDQPTNSVSPTPQPAANPSGSAAGTYVTPLASSCVRKYWDPQAYNWLSFENDCGQSVSLTFIFHHNVGWAMTGGMDLAPGAHQNTGRSSSDINQAQGFDIYVCPGGYVPVDLNGNSLLNTNVAEYRCKAQ
jgi:hypothetical protein